MAADHGNWGVSAPFASGWAVSTSQQVADRLDEVQSVTSRRGELAGLEGRWSNIAAQIAPKGNATWGDSLKAIDQNAAYLGRLGETVADASQLFAFEALQADGLCPVANLIGTEDAWVAAPGCRLNSNGPSKERHCSALSPSVLWDMVGPTTGSGRQPRTTLTAPLLSSRPTAGTHLPARQPPPHHYIWPPGDQATLLLSGDSKSYTLLETDGTLRTFSVSDGSLQYVADADGNRITLAYSNGHLTKLTHSSGQWLQIGYSSDRITSLTDSVGRKTVFSYDANQQLVQSSTTTAGPSPTIITMAAGQTWNTQ